MGDMYDARSAEGRKPEGAVPHIWVLVSVPGAARVHAPHVLHEPYTVHPARLSACRVRDTCHATQWWATVFPFLTCAPCLLSAPT